MNQNEAAHIIAAILIFAAILAAPAIWNADWPAAARGIFFAALIIIVSVAAKKVMANSLDSDAEHEIWHVRYFGWRSNWHFKKPVPAGLIVPLFFSVFTLGLLKIPTLLTYEARAKKQRAAKRFGYYSYAELTEWHNGLIGAAGMIAVLLLAVLAYLLPSNQEELAKLAIYYVFWNLIPVSKLDGSQIFFGSRVLWTVLAVITVILTAGSLLIS